MFTGTLGSSLQALLQGTLAKEFGGSPFVTQYSPLSAFSLQDLTGTNPSVVRVRRGSDNAESDFTAPELTDGTLVDWVGSYSATLPLDTASAEAAYSLRYVRSAYTGDVVRVRRDSDNAESDFNPAEISDGTMATWIGANNGFVSTWYDQSGNGYDVVQATVANQPKIYDSVTGLILENSKPALSFDGTNDGLTASTGVSLSANSKAWFAVFQTSATADGVFGTPFDGSYLWGIKTSSLEAAGGPSPVTYTPSGQMLVSATHDTSTGQLWKNGTSQGTQSWAGTVPNSAFIRIGSDRSIGTTFFNGTMQELIYYESDQSSNRATIEGNINQHYDIYSANGFVTTWYDQSGNGNNFTQSTAGSQPKIVSSGSVITGTNGLPAVELDGTDDNLRSVATFAGHATFDCYTAMEVGSESLYILYSEFSSGAKRSFIAQSASSSTNIYDGFGTPALYANGALQSPANRGDVFTAHAGQKIMTYLGADTSTWTNGYLSFFGTAEYTGKIQEMIFFNTDSSSNRAAIETSMNSRWSMY